MTFKKNFDFNSRIILDIKTDDVELINSINSFWKIGNDLFDTDGYLKNLTTKISQYCSVEFDNGIYKSSLIKVETTFELVKAINLFKIQLEKEFQNYSKSSKKLTIELKDVYNLFNSRLNKNKISKEKILKTSSTESLLKTAYQKLLGTEFNCLLVIAVIGSKDEIVAFFTNKGFNWNAINKLEKLGLIWINRDFYNKIIEFYVEKSLKNRLINYVEDEGIDVYNLEIV